MAGIHHQAQKHEFGSHSVAFALGSRAGGDREGHSACGSSACTLGRAFWQKSAAGGDGQLSYRSQGSEGGARAQPAGSFL